MATTESIRHAVQVVITQQLPDQPLPGEILVNAPNNFSVITNNKNKQKANDQGTSKSQGKMHEAAPKDEETSKRHAEIYEAVLKGDWSKADEKFSSYRGDAGSKLTDNGDTALHVATATGKKDFVKKLMSKYMEEIDLKEKNKEENTAFSIAVMLGNTELAEMMLKKNNDLTTIRKSGMLPVEMAAMLGNAKMVTYLYEATKCYFNESYSSTKKDLIELLVRLIDNDLYDVAVSLVNEFSQLAVLRDEKKETALHALVKRPLTNSCQGILKRFYHGGINMVQNKKMNPKALNLFNILWQKVVSQLDYYNTVKLIEEPFGVYLAAAAEGNTEFLSVLIREHPELLFKADDEGRTIFHVAVSHRQENIFKLICEDSSITNVIFASKVGEKQNNILHLAGELPTENRLNVVPGAALQMQRELMWFEEVKKLMPPFYAEDINKDDKTARTLFTESHQTLMKKGEQWMKKTAESCMLVATLIATVAFAATFTLPGGIKDDTGTSNFLKKASFMIFIISDTVSLVSTSCSILAFLSILTARYAEEDFRWRLPLKLLLGLSTLLISIIAMMIVFCTALFIVFNEGTKWPAVLAVGLASVPVIMFLLLQIPLLSDVTGLMCLFKSFSRKKTLWNLFTQPS